MDVLSSGRARNQILATCARNVWSLSVMYNISIVVSHVRGRQNTVARTSRWHQDYTKLHQCFFQDPVWVDTHIDLSLLKNDV